MAEYEVWLKDAAGNRLQPPVTKFLSLEWTRALNDVGWLDMKLSSEADRQLYRRWRWAYVWRRPEGGMLTLVRPYLINYIERGYEGPSPYLRVIGACPNWLLAGRIVAYDGDTAEADKSGAADDLMKEYVDENMVSATDTDRNLSLVTVQGDASAGPTVDYEASYANLLQTLQEISAATDAAGTRVLFDMHPNTTQSFEFRTYIGQLGRDRRHGQGANALVLSVERGNIANPVLIEDGRDEANVVYGLGTGLYGYRELSEQEDTARTSASVWARREGAANGGGIDDLDALEDAALTGLEDGRPGRSFSAKVLERPGARYQVDYDFGDRVTIEFLRERMDCEIATMHGKLAGQAETLEVGVRYVA